LIFQLRCTVRDCQQLLEQHERELVCGAGHHFDQAKQGYWNLLQPQDKKSKKKSKGSGLFDSVSAWCRLGFFRFREEFRCHDPHELMKLADFTTP